MICEKCGKDFSEKVWHIHKNICKGNKPTKEPKKDYSNLSYNELRQVIKEKGLDIGKNPKKAEMLKALGDADA